jgi:hypothetical protein
MSSLNDIGYRPDCLDPGVEEALRAKKKPQGEPGAPRRLRGGTFSETLAKQRRSIRLGDAGHRLLLEFQNQFGS